MQRIGTWVDWNGSCDRFVAGDPQAEVTGIAVAWQSRTDAIRQALEQGCNLFVTHEPTFYTHTDDDAETLRQPHAAAKLDFIRKSGAVIYRCHDVWDRMPGIGIVDSWAAHLGLEVKTASDEFHAVYESPAPTLIALARHVARATDSLGQPIVEMAGDPGAKTGRVGIGCGAITDYRKMVDLGADAIVGTDDGMSYWAGGSWALDRGVGLVIVNHPTAEEPGMRALADYLRGLFAGVRVEHLPQGAMYTCVGSQQRSTRLHTDFGAEGDQRDAGSNQ